MSIRKEVLSEACIVLFMISDIGYEIENQKPKARPQHYL